MNTNSAFTGSYSENPFWYQQFDLTLIRPLREDQPIVDFDAADKRRLYVTTMKAINFGDDIPRNQIDIFKHHCVLVFDLTSLQDATENCPYPSDNNTDTSSQACLETLKRIFNFRNNNDFTENKFRVADQSFYQIDIISAEAVENCAHFFRSKYEHETGVEFV